MLRIFKNIAYGIAMMKFQNPCVSVDDNMCSNFEMILVNCWNRFGFYVCLFCHTLNVAVPQGMSNIKSKTEHKNVKNWYLDNYWMHGLLLFTFSAFSGGTAAPIFIQDFPFIVVNDMIFIFCIISWCLSRYCGTIIQILNSTVVKCIWTNLAMVNRSHTICSIINATVALVNKQDSVYFGRFSLPIVGPIIVAVVISCGGMFFPLSKGFKPIANGAPVVILGATLISCFYHIYVNDTYGVLGVSLRVAVHNMMLLMGYPASDTLHVLSEPEVKAVVVYFWWTVMTIQIVTNVNVLTPLVELFYICGGAQRPEPATKATLKGAAL